MSIWEAGMRSGEKIWDEAEAIAKRDGRDLIEVMKTDLGVDVMAMRPASKQCCLEEAARRMGTTNVIHLGHEK